MNQDTTSRCKQRGMASIWVILALPVIIAFLGLSIDVGFMVWSGQKLQDGADAAALAGARALRDGVMQARTAAVNIGAANDVAGDAIQLNSNPGNSPNGDVIIGRFDRTSRTFTTTFNNVNAVRVQARRTSSAGGGQLPLFFGQIFGINSVDLQRTAVAMVEGGPGAGVLVLNETARDALEFTGSGTINVQNGAVHVNSSHSSALRMTGSTTITATDLSVVGDISQTGSSTINANIDTDADVMPDPLSSLAEPLYNPSNNLGSISLTGSGTLNNVMPGYYSGGIRMTGSGSMTLLPGIYILNGHGLSITGSGSFTALNCLFYIVGNGDVTLTGSGAQTITAPDPDVAWYPGADTYEGISFFQSRSNTNYARITGSGSFSVGGTIYMPSNQLRLTGSGDQLGNQLIVNTLDISGSGTIFVPYDGRNSGNSNTAFLVD